MSRLNLRYATNVILILSFSTFSWIASSHAAVVASDGGITLWISYDNLDMTGATLGDTITESNSIEDFTPNCDPTNGGRSTLGASNSPASCPGGSTTCTAEEKVTADINKLADYISQSTEGAHYLRRVYLSDEGRAWEYADIKWNIGLGGSTAPFGWAVPGSNLNLNSGFRTCIHDVVHHELGHYIYNLPDRYAQTPPPVYYRGTMPGDTTMFDVSVTAGDINTVMSSNFPHLFVDTTNASITVDYDPPGPSSITGEVLTPSLLTDGDPSNDGPNRAHHGHTNPFAQDEWSLLPSRHVDLTDVHTEGTFAAAGTVPEVDIVIIGDDEPHPGTALLLDRSGSMSVQTNGITAAQYVQEAGMFLYHSADDGDLVGTYLYNANVEELFEYDEYDSSNDLPLSSFRDADGLTDIAGALEEAIDELIDEHGEGAVNGAEIYLMSDGRQTTGSSLWDQVDRANEQGIKIHTFLFGNADSSTMNGIASGSGGNPTPMSERNDAAELKMLMTRQFSTGRGLTPIFVFKGVMRDRINLGATSIHFGQFSIPPKTRDLQFYAFLHSGDASKELTLHLRAPNGDTFNSPPPDNVARKARLNGIKVDKVESGVWSYFVAGTPGAGLTDEPIEIAAYANNRELKGRVWVEDIEDDGNTLLHATLNFRYPLTKMNVSATVYAAGNPIAVVPFFDDGSNGDDFADDGIYAALIAFNSSEWKERLAPVEQRVNNLRIEAEFDVIPSTIPAPSAHYETGFTPDMALADYSRGNLSTFTAWATTVINLSDTNPDRLDKNPAIEDDPTNGSIIAPPGGTGKIQFILKNARVLPSQLRVSLGQGVSAQITDIEDEYNLDDNAMVDSEGKKKQKPNGDEKLNDATNAEPRRTKYTLEFKVQKNAVQGLRSLRVQFGETILKLPKILLIDE